MHAYGEWIKHVLAPLGPWGMLAFAAVDGSFLGMPLDAYEFLLLISAHSERHTKQILEVEADPNYPKK